MTNAINHEEAGESASIPCDGCGATENSKRCIGCLHDFGTPESAWVQKYTRPATQQQESSQC
jgi:hypothetical protein